MIRILFGGFLVLHGLVHLLYLGQSWRFFKLQAGLVWPDGSWAFSALLGEGGTRTLASISCLLAAVGFVTGGVALIATQSWWYLPVVASAFFFAAMTMLLWDGQMQRLADKGGVGVLINIAILSIVLGFGQMLFPV
ncbi:MAG: hypothetical protein KDD84_21335 [Caldilineaceae bacterium]|nr:hypothetical protein [Caldilineaceae bacterium]